MRCRVFTDVLIKSALCAPLVLAGIEYTYHEGNTVSVVAEGLRNANGTFTPLSHEEINRGLEAMQHPDTDTLHPGVTDEREGSAERDLVISSRPRKEPDSARGQFFQERRVAQLEQPRTERSVALIRRQVVAAVGAVLLAAETILVMVVIITTAKYITEAVREFSERRQAFTRSAVDQAWAYRTANETWARYMPAAMCYNQAWDARYPDNIAGKVSMTLRQRVLHVSFDCFFVVGPNDIYTRGGE